MIYELALNSQIIHINCTFPELEFLLKMEDGTYGPYNKFTALHHTCRQVHGEIGFRHLPINIYKLYLPYTVDITETRLKQHPGQRFIRTLAMTVYEVDFEFGNNILAIQLRELRRTLQELAKCQDWLRFESRSSRGAVGGLATMGVDLHGEEGKCYASDAVRPPCDKRGRSP